MLMKTNSNNPFLNVADMSLKRRAKRIIEELELKDGDKVLDMGCAHGFYIDLLKNLDLKLDIFGADIDREALSYANKKYKGENIHLVYGDLMDKLPFRTNTFDKIIMSEVCEHLPNDLQGLREVNRVLKPNGILVLTVPNRNYPLLWDPVNWIRDHTGNKHFEKGVFAGIWTNHIRLYKPNEITSVVKKAKFTIISSEALTWWSLPFNHNLLYGGKLSKKAAKEVSSYIKKRSWIVSSIFHLINLNDRINDHIRLKKIGVNIIVKARK